jgi:outer membrane receptor protein involved in Fe transport
MFNFTVICTALWGQQLVTGVITDFGSKPIPGIVVEVKGANTKVLTNQDGSYTIAVPKGYSKLIFRHADYQGKEIEISGEEVNVVLDRASDIFGLSLDDLMNITITTASRKEEKIADIPASIILVTKQDIELYGYRTLEEILENVPGLNIVDIFSWGGLSTGVRGSWTQYNNNMAILINGDDQRNNYLDDYSIRQCNVPVEAIERIEIVKGPMSVLYGSGAFFGAINIITKPLSKDTEDAAATVSYGSQNTHKVAVTKNYIKEDFSLSTNAM